MNRRLLRLGVAAGLTAAAAGCGDDDDAGRAGDTASSSSVPTAATEGVETTSPESAAPPGVGDGVLTIGVLLPQTGDGSTLGNFGINAATLAVNRINDAGGVFGNRVELLVENEGATVEEARLGIDELLRGDVDAVVGPASSTVAMETIDELTAAGVVTCSPLASALALNNYPNRDLFFRTIPSDSVIAQAMAQLVVNTGVSSTTVVYLDDDYGRPLGRLTIERLRALEIEEVREVPFPGHDEDLTDEVRQLVENPTRSVVIVADSEQGWRMLTAISDELGDDPPDHIVVNAPMRAAPIDEVRELPPGVRQTVQGVSPAAAPRVGDDEDMKGNFSMYSFDCVNLLALAAVATGSDDPADIAGEMVNVSIVGQGCNSFEDCVAFLSEDRNIRYDGPNTIQLSRRGDPSRGGIEIFGFDDRGFDVARGWMSISDPVD